MPKRGEFVGYQKTVPGFSDLDFVPVYSEGEAGEPYMRISQSKLEHFAQFLQNPFIDPNRLGAESYVRLLSGVAFHRVVQTTEIMRRAWAETHSDQPKRSLFEVYEHNLQHIAEYMPTSKSGQVRSFIAILDDERLALPRENMGEDTNAKLACYEIVLESVLDDLYQKGPFTNSIKFDFGSEFDLPEPSPWELFDAWDGEGMTERLRQRVTNLFWFHENLAVIPGTTGHGFSGTEVRINFIFHDFNMIFTMRLDEITLVKSLFGRPTLNVIDYKSGSPKYPYTEEEKEALQTSLFFTAQALIRLKLPDDLRESGGRAIVVDSMQRKAAGVNVNIKYLGFSDYPPHELDLTRYHGHEWTDDFRHSPAFNQVGEFLQKIRERKQELKDLLNI